MKPGNQAWPDRQDRRGYPRCLKRFDAAPVPIPADRFCKMRGGAQQPLHVQKGCFCLSSASRRKDCSLRYRRMNGLVLTALVSAGGKARMCRHRTPRRLTAIARQG